MPHIRLTQFNPVLKSFAGSPLAGSKCSMRVYLMERSIGLISITTKFSAGFEIDCLRSAF
jgi:hypothetical protein